MIQWKAGTCVRRSQERNGIMRGTGSVGRGWAVVFLLPRLGVVEFVPDFFITRTRFLVESHNIDNGLGMLLLLFLRDPAVL